MHTPLLNYKTQSTNIFGFASSVLNTSIEEQVGVNSELQPLLAGGRNQDQEQAELQAPRKEGCGVDVLVDEGAHGSTKGERLRLFA